MPTNLHFKKTSYGLIWGFFFDILAKGQNSVMPQFRPEKFDYECHPWFNNSSWVGAVTSHCS